MQIPTVPKISNKADLAGFIASSPSSPRQRIKPKDIEPFREFLIQSMKKITVEYSHHLPTAFSTDPEDIVFSSDIINYRLNLIPPRVQCIEHIGQFSLELSRNRSLRTLSLIRVGVNSEYVTPLAQALGTIDHLTSLDLSGNPMGCLGVRELARGVAANKLEELKLSGTGMGSEGLNYLAEALAGKTSLRVLDLSNNPTIGQLIDTPWENLAQALKTCLGIETLILKKCYIFPWAASRLAEAIELHPSLRRLDLGDNKIKTLFNHRIISEVPSTTGTGTVLECSRPFQVSSFAQLIANNPSLRELYLNDNEVDDEGVRALIQGLEVSESTSLHLDLRNNPKISLGGTLQLFESTVSKPGLKVKVTLIYPNVALTIRHANIKTLTHLCLNQLRKNGPIIDRVEH